MDYDKPVFEWYVLWLHLIFVSLIPMVVLLSLNRAIHVKLSERHMLLRRTGHRSLRRRELRLARGSLFIVWLFMFCHLPKLIPSVCEILFNNDKVKLKHQIFKSMPMFPLKWVGAFPLY